MNNKMVKQTFELTTEFQKEVVSRLDAEVAKVAVNSTTYTHLDFPNKDLDDISNIFMDVMKDVIEDFNRGVM